jgi:tetratricopeptide (TPR) repeat protein
VRGLNEETVESATGVVKAAVLHHLGNIHYAQGRYEEAEKMYQESLKINEELGNKSGIASTLGQFGNIHYAQGRYEEAEKMYQESLKLEEELGDKSGIATTLHQLGMIHQQQGRYEEAEKMYQEGTIEKVSDFLIFHPSYPTFSSCSQIVNHHKVIPH